jgi:AraC family transcriptional regulator of adaptative response/methylated-DNA-[protein]-cysteine methyltransferase
VLVAGTDQGICAIELGDTPEGLQARLQERFPLADLQEGAAAFRDWVQQVLVFLEAPGDRLDLPLDIQGTAFQRRVWLALRDIPAGTTLSYSAVAARIGQPKATRAVAQACASNKLAVAIPCHRVVRQDGDLGGYRWGIPRKQALLGREAQAAIVE